MAIPRSFGNDINSSGVLSVGASAGIIPSTGVANAHVAAGAVIAGSKLAANARKRFARSVWFNLDNGAGTTVDDVIIRPSVAITILAVRAVYVDVTSGTVAAGNFRVGTSAGGEQVCLATAYGNSKAVGTATDGAIESGAITANQPVCVRHTGVAATAVGQAYVEIEFTVDD